MHTIGCIYIERSLTVEMSLRKLLWRQILVIVGLGFMSFPAEKLSSLRQLIHSKINDLGVQDKIKECIDTGDNEQGRASEEHLLSQLRDKGVIDDILASLKLSRDVTDKTSGAVDSVDQCTNCTCEQERAGSGVKQNKRYVFLRVAGGKAFVEHLQESEMTPEHTHTVFTLHVHFRQQRFKSRPVPCSCEPNIQEGFLLELSKHYPNHPDYEMDKIVTPNDALSIRDPIHLVLTKTDKFGEINLVGSRYLEWRHILSDTMGRVSTAIELNGIGSESSVPAGLLDITMEIVPKVTSSVSQDVVMAQLSLERSRCAEKERMFLVYAKQWWKEYLQIRQQHAQRLVKVFAQDENATNRLVCMYVRSLRAGRLLDSPQHAARFVSLIPYERVASIGSSGGTCRPEQWCSLHSFLCRKCGDCEDHALLLCSLLLGFGLNAFVCVGCKKGGVAHTWVMTVAPDGSTTFWESLTGERFSHKPVEPDHPAGVPVPQPQHPYHTLGCVFNHRSFYANCQSSDSLLVCQMDLNNQSLWKPISEEAIKSITEAPGLPAWSSLPPLCGCGIDPVMFSNELEIELRSLTSQYRMDNGLTTQWDDNLCYLLTPALAAYELERCVAMTSAGNKEFQEAIRWAVPQGHIFKGFPIQFVHRNAHKMFATCLKSPICVDIIGCRGDHVRHALRVKCYPYPEDVCAVWVMFAVKYRSVL